MKNIKSAHNNNKFEITVPTWNDEFDLPHIQSHAFRITLNLSPKNTKLWLKILAYKFTPIKPKTGSLRYTKTKIS